MSKVRVNADGSGFAKSSFTEANFCVELHRGFDAVRDSKNRDSVLYVPTTASDALLTFVRRY